MTITQLEYLLAVVNYGSFSVASEYCFATQSALSKQINLLEEELGAVLLDRSERPVTLTEAGKVFLERAKNTVGNFYETRNVINDLKGQLSGKLRVAAIPTVSPYLMPKFVARFAKRCPDVKFEIVDMFASDIFDALNRDLIDVGILTGGSGQPDAGYRETELFDDRLLMYVARDNRLYGRRSVSVDEVDVKKLLILSQGNCLRNQSLKLCQKRKKMKAQLQYDFFRCSLETLMHTADETGGTTIIPGMAIGYIPRDRYDQIVPFDSKRALRKVVMAVGRTFMRDSLTDAVRQTLIEVGEELKIAEFLID